MTTSSPAEEKTCGRYASGEYLSSNPTWHVQDSSWKAAQILQMLNRAKIAPKTIYEIGCGAGEILKCLHDRLPQVAELTGFEISPQAYELCRSRATERLKFFQTNLLTEDVPKADLLLVIDVIEHVPDCFGFVKQLNGKSNYKLFHIPLDMCGQKVIRGTPIMTLRNQVGHIHYFSKDTALAMLCESGLEIIDWYYTATTLDLPPKSLKARLMRLPRKLLFQLRPDFAVRLLGGFSLMVMAR